MVTIDVKLLLIWILLIALIVLVIYLAVVVKNLIPAVKKTNKILDDASVVTGIVSEKAQESEQTVDDLLAGLKSFSNAIKGDESVIASLSSIAKAGASLASIFKKND